MADIITIENNLKQYIEDGINRETFFYDFIENYNISTASITRARNRGITSIKNKVLYESVPETSSPIARVTEMANEILGERNKPRIVIVTNFIELAAIDIKTGDSLIIPINGLPKYAEFFLPWNGIEKVDYSRENPTDIKAALRFQNLYHELRKINSFNDKTEEEHAFNLFLIRLLFLLFAEDTDIIPKGSFTNIIKLRTLEDGSDFNKIISEIYASLDRSERKLEPDWLRDLPYVNGNLFSEVHVDLVFDKQTRALIIEAGELLNWNEINPDILGAMIQTVANGERRSVTGMHYTSVENILRVLSPLFLDEINEIKKNIFERIEENENKIISEKSKKDNRRKFIEEIKQLLERLSKIKVFDPACGSGNFLIIAYKELRRIEIELLAKIDDLQPKESAKGGSLFVESKISLNSFIGIEIDDFAHEVARLSLWIAEHQMNIEMETAIKNAKVSLLPLHDEGQIYVGNSLRNNWETLVGLTDEQLFIVGNPPYRGSKKLSLEQKNDLKIAVGEKHAYKMMDYVSGWFFKAVELMKKINCQVAFVTTNSICQGEQVALIWSELLKSVDIHFAYLNFKWNNNAGNNAGVTVNIIGLSPKMMNLKRYLYDGNGLRKQVSNITPYLTENENIIVKKENHALNGLPKMHFGNMPNDGGGLVITLEERNEYLASYPELSNYIKKFIGSEELINGKYRYALWLTEEDYNKLKSNPIVKDRVLRTYNHRLTSSAKYLAEVPWRFRDTNITDTQSIIIPRVSSENRDYIPMGIMGDDTVISDSAMVIYNAPIYLLGLLESRMHMTWMRAVGGKLENRYRYSAGLVYNTFPVPQISEQVKAEIEECVFEILDYREESGKTLAELYSVKTMPPQLLEIHQRLDLLVDKLYQTKAFASDQERLTLLLKMYKEKVEFNE